MERRRARSEKRNTASTVHAGAAGKFSHPRSKSRSASPSKAKGPAKSQQILFDSISPLQSAKISGLAAVLAVSIAVFIYAFGLFQGGLEAKDAFVQSNTWTLNHLLLGLHRFFYPAKKRFPIDLPADVAPWPSFRANCENTGFVNMRTHSKGGADAMYWSFQTGRGIFSVPAISADGHVLIGSADRRFYAIDEASGLLLWHINTDEIIDSAAAIYKSNVIFASGDGHVYNVSIDTGRLNWKFAAHHSADTPDENQGYTCGDVGASGGTSTWFEGQVQISPIDGRVYVGNDDYRLYSLHANGSEAYSFHPGPLPYGTIWSGPAITRSGSVIGTAMNGKYFKLDKNGKCIWFHEEMNSISSGPAIEADLQLVFLGSWNGIMRGVNHTTGNTVWTFSAGDSIYGGAAVDPIRRRIYFGSQDGVFYALDSRTGKSVWRFRVNYPIRTSPALAADAVYFGAANGMLYALNPETGGLLWAFDTTEDPDHREINASPALGHASVIFGSEDGRIISIPYRHCLKEATRSDPRCHTQLSEVTVGSVDGRRLYYLHPGGMISPRIPNDLSIGAEFHIRLLVVSDNKTRTAHVIRATAELAPPTTPLTIDYLSTSGSILVKPKSFLESATDYNLTITVFDNSISSTRQTFTFRTAPREPKQAFPEGFATNSSKVTAIHLYNLKPSYPPSWISLNQIGFDSVNLLISTIHRIKRNDAPIGSPTSYYVWIAAGLLNPNTSITLDPTAPTLAPGILTLHADGTTFQLQSQFSLITGGPPIPMTGFTVASRFDSSSSGGGGGAITFGMAPRSQSWMSWSSWCGDSLSSLLGAIQTNMCSSRGRIVTVGAVRGRVYDTPLAERARVRAWAVAGVVVKPVGWIGADVEVAVRIARRTTPRGDQPAPMFAVALFDETRETPIYLDYKNAMTIAVDAATGERLVQAVFQLGGGGRMESVREDRRVRVIVMADLHPIHNSVAAVPVQ